MKRVYNVTEAVKSLFFSYMLNLRYTDQTAPFFFFYH